THEQVLANLEQLLAADIITRTSNAPGPAYEFRHALIQEVAYQSLLRRTRTQTHLRLAELFEQDKRSYPDITYELIAEHYARAGAILLAVAARRRAAAAANARSAQIEAANLLEMAIESLSELPHDIANRRLELELTMELASALGAVRGYAAPKVEHQYRKARDLCLELANTALRFNVEFGLMISHLVNGDLESADLFATGLPDFAEYHPNKPLADAYLAQGMVKVQQGRFEEARDLLRQAITFTRPEDDQPHFFSHGENPGILCRSYLAQ